jgi:hypothetical protein
MTETFVRQGRREVPLNSGASERTSFLLVLAAVGCGALASQAATIHVPADQPSIQAGINVATNGDIVLVSPGTYFESIDFLGKAITVESQAGPDSTIIDGELIHRVVTFTNGEDRDSVLRGFTIRNGKPVISAAAVGGGGGILMANDRGHIFAFCN